VGRGRHARALTLAAAALALGPAPARAGRTAPEVNAQWSGYAVSARHVSYSSVGATWTQPAARCRPGDAGALSAAWVGLGGHSRTSLEQVGTDASCDAAGRPSYFAWFELVAGVAHRVPRTVRPGDEIVGSVRRLEPNLVELRIEDRTRRWTFARRIVWGTADVSSAEWIVEAPYACVRFSCRHVALANFGTVTFRNVRAVGNGAPGSLASRRWTLIPIELVPCVRPGGAGSRAGARPGPASADGRTFAVAWLADAGRGSACKSRPTTIGGLPDVTKG
jgi:Peptidase A4 family